jgi:hypothetical protein
MAAPVYFAEKRYSYHVYGWTAPVFSDYQAADPQTTFERQVQAQYAQGYAYLRQEEYYLALNAFRELQNLILTTVHPTLPIDIHRKPDWVFPMDPSLIDAFAAKVGRELQLLPMPGPGLPDPVLGKAALADPVEKRLSLFESTGLAITTQRGKMGQLIEDGLAAVGRGAWADAVTSYTAALQQVPANDATARGSILHDLAIVTERAGQPTNASIDNATQAAKLFGDAKNFDAQVHALETLAGIQSRSGDANAAAGSIKQATDIVKAQRLFGVTVPGRLDTGLKTGVGRLGGGVIGGVGGGVIGGVGGGVIGGVGGGVIGGGVIGGVGGGVIGGGVIGGIGHAPAAPAAGGAVALDPGVQVAAAPQIADIPSLLGTTLVGTPATERAFRISTTAPAPATLRLTGDLTANVKGYLTAVAASDDLTLVLAYDLSHVEMVAYLPSMYFFVIPMAIGDCLAGLGNYAEAETQYRSTLVYPFINLRYEAVNLWLKLATTYLELGDQAYRAAKDDVGQYATAKAFYERIIKTDKTLDAASPLYQDAKFAAIKTRAQNFINANLAPAHPDNPALLAKMLEANVKLQQIALGLNYFGFAPTYAPPFSFEYLQNTAKYFAGQASHIEQRYIQFKSAAESETLQREQLDQQAEVARQTVVLEQRGVAEAQAGVATAQANLSYANVQLNNANQARNDFNAVRDDLLELTELEAWANAASVDQDDEVQLTISGFSTYNSDHKRRSLVVADLARKKARITHQLEAGRLDREVAAATSYRGVAQAQVNQAQARVAIAQQRVAIAQLQQRNAEENRDFMDLKEFSARLWYDLAREAKRLKDRYLDMATEISFLTERAYNAETERGVNVIRFDYRFTPAGNLMGADRLLADLDFFTFDLITTTRTKKAPVKRVISLADAFPMAFQRLTTTGTCNFQTTLGMFDRQAPGMFLCKTRNIELQFVGIANATLAGTLRNGGVSTFRRPDGTVITRMYPADVMPLSSYEIRQDALAFRVNPNDLRLFENNGIETQWQIDLPRSANDFDYNEILDVQLVMYYDGFFSPALETQVKAALPPGGSAARALSMRMLFPDELFFLKSNGEGRMALDASLFPRNQKNMTRTRLTLKASGASAANLTLHVVSQNHGADLRVATDANGLVLGNAPGDPLGALRNEALLDTWTIRINAADNPGLVQNGQLNLQGIADIGVYVEYDFLFQ